MNTTYRFLGCDPCWYCIHRVFDDKGLHITGGCNFEGPTLADARPCPSFKAIDLPSDDLVDELLNEQPRLGKAFVFDRCMEVLLAVAGDVAERGYDPKAAEVLIEGLCVLLKEIQIKSLVGGLGSPWLEDIGRTKGYGAWMEWRRKRMTAGQKDGVTE